MFARIFHHLTAGGAFATAAAITLVVGSACRSPVDCLCALDSYTAVAWGANVVPVTTDTAPRAVVNIVTNITANTVAWVYSVSTAPAGTIDSIALYQVAAGQPLPASATAILCAGTAACAATSGTATVVAPATAATITTSLRAYGTQVVVFTTTAQKAAGGAMRGTMYVLP